MNAMVYTRMHVRGLLSSSLILSLSLMKLHCNQMDKWFRLSFPSPTCLFVCQPDLFTYLVHHVVRQKMYWHSWEDGVGCRSAATQSQFCWQTKPLSQCTSPAAKWMKLGTKLSYSQAGDTALKCMPFPYSLSLTITTNQWKSKSSRSFSAARTFCFLKQTT